ncbi:aldo/keto reductase [Arthrobacter sp. OV608]|uniref:aldo/keto reductase n=1 Tax=Arthrobacter sp. OV608 TaxID=1882768 RepID=UPI0008C3169A|nr:aldo/keto reductase [Arthrobacter sp. OV608]SEQ70162.1 Predicted oxidoreductase [Arthrobacter sp. OV608]
MHRFEERNLTSSGLRSTVLGFGAMELRGASHRVPRLLEEGVAKILLNTVLDEGIQFIDTSIDYGESEELIGRYIGHRRSEYLLASKVGCPLDHQPGGPTNGPLVHDYSPTNIRAGIEQSLSRLRTDYLDLAQVHIGPSVAVLQRDDVLGTLERARDEGKVRAIGISSTFPELLEHIDLGVFETFQVPYSALDRSLEQRLPLINATGAGVIVRGGTARAARAKRTQDSWHASPVDLDVDDLLDGDNLQGFLLRFVVSRTEVSTVIVGTASPEHVRENAKAAARGGLPEDVYAEAQRRLDIAGFRTSDPRDQAS